MQKIIIIGSAYPLRGGGIATFNERLAEELQSTNNKVSIYSFSLQYPSLLFPGSSQYSTDPAPKNLDIHAVINSINPLNWLKVANKIVREKPDLVIIRYWIPFMAPCLGTIARIIRKKINTNIICIADNIVPHEKRIADQLLTKYFMKSIHGFITMSNQVTSDLLTLHPKAKYIQTAHPLYDNFGPMIEKREARSYLKLEENKKILLFFGFIREYKGLDLLIEAMSNPAIKQQEIKLIVAGEFYQNKQPYLQRIQSLSLENSIIIIDEFISNELVKYYCCAADAIIQPYKKATQSGVTPLAYHFEVPMIVTNVGGLPEMVKDGISGLICEPNVSSIAEHIIAFFSQDPSKFKDGIKIEKNRFSWKSFVEHIKTLQSEI